MPLKKCSSDGKSGWKWGDSGHCYTGDGAKKKALKQGYAIDKEHFKENVRADLQGGTASREEVAAACLELQLDPLSIGWILNG